MFEGASTEVSSYAIALYSGLWAFDGYDQANVSRRFLHHNNTLWDLMIRAAMNST